MPTLFPKNFDLFLSKRKRLPPATRNPEISDQSNTHSYSSSTSLTPSPTTNADHFSSFSDDSSFSDFAAAFASHRFFISSPGRSNSIFESSETRPGAGPDHVSVAEEGAERVAKYSLDPYVDFRRSMEEMIGARERADVRTDWNYLHELLSSYLRLNPKGTHKFIITAFADLLLCLLAASPTPAPLRENLSSR